MNLFAEPDNHAIGRSRGVVAGIPQPADQIGHRKWRGSTGGRPLALGAVDSDQRNARSVASHLIPKGPPRTST